MTRTRSHLVVTSAQVRSGRLRPSQGGAFHPPVGPPVDHPAREPETKGIALLPHQRDLIHGTDGSTWALRPGQGSLEGAIARAMEGYPPPVFEKVKDGVTFTFNYGAAPAAPPVDAELEAERVRLVGKRVRHVRSVDHVINGQVVTRMERDRDGETPLSVSTNGYCLWIARAFEPIPEEPRTIKDAVVTFADLAIGERFEFIGLPYAGAFERCDSGYAIAGNSGARGWCSGKVEVRRLAPPGGGA